MKADRTIRLATDADKKAWNTVVSHPLQSWEWGEFRIATGREVVRLAVTEGNKIIDGWQLTFHPVPYTPYTIGYFPKGPLPTKEMSTELLKIGKEKRAIFIQLEPNALHDLAFSIQHLAFLRPSHHPLFTKYTFVLDLTKSEEELLKNMHPKTRYNIKVAQKHGVAIQEDNSEEGFAAYLKLTEETTNRQGFYAHTRRYHELMWKTLRKTEGAHLFTATYQGNILAAWILFVWKDTLYYPYGASSREYREVMAPNLLLWEIVRWAKKLGLKQFDLWGALGPNPDTNDPWYGFHRFKEGYRPQLVEFLGSYDLIIQPFLYALYTIADTVRWNVLRRGR